MMVAQAPSAPCRVTRRWELTHGALHALLARLDQDPGRAAEKYEHLRRALLKFFSWQCTTEPEASVDATLDRIARRLDSGHAIDDVPAFAYGVARLVRLEQQRLSAAMRTVSDEHLENAAAPAPPAADGREACLQDCLAELSEGDRELILAYYAGTGRDRIGGRAQLAAALGVSDNALRLRAQRIRDRLRIRAAQRLEQAGPAAAAMRH
jgi:DNA-directed RNA polymerase specialized sigma24 family protein